MMIMPLVAIFINPIWSKFSKNINYNRIFIRILTVIEAIAVVILANIGANVWLIILVIFIIAVVGQPYYILFDSFTVMYAKQKIFHTQLLESLAHYLMQLPLLSQD